MMLTPEQKRARQRDYVKRWRDRNPDYWKRPGERSMALRLNAVRMFQILERIEQMQFFLEPGESPERYHDRIANLKRAITAVLDAIRAPSATAQQGESERDFT